MVNDAMLQLNFEKTNKQEKKYFLRDAAQRILRIRWGVRIM